jgi:hypothetical protein
MFFLFNIVGYYLWFSYAKNNIQKEIRQEIRKGLAEKDLTVISVPLDDESGIRWLKAGKEFTYHGEMFDVVKIKTDKDKKYFYCINDAKEKKLLADFSNHNEPDSKTRKLLSFFQYIYILQAESFFNILETSNHDYCINSFAIVSTIKEVTSPPPKNFLQA